MMCPHCGQRNAMGVAICSNCATPLANLCANCGFENPRGFKFCGNCGVNLLNANLARSSNSEKLRRVQGIMPSPLVDKILNASKQIEGERRTVTVLFSDVVGFTTISEKLDPETVYNIIDASVAAFRDEIYAHEGTLDKFMGDGVMALFGAPVMHEDDPVRAVRCALGMQAALKLVNDEMVAQRGITLQMRIGLNLGTVVVADIGADLRMNYTALGDTVNVAARLQSVAEPGTILVSRAVYEQTRALFEYTELGSIRVKGRVEPVEIFQVVGTKREPGRVRGIPGLVAPMVGRDQELARVQHLVDTLTRDGHGSLVLITGEAGLGKSRLTGELKQWIARTPELNAVRIHEGGCVAYGQSAYDLVVRVLNSLLELNADDSPIARRAKIEARVRELVHDNSVLEILPYIENLMGLTPTERELADRIRHLEPVQLRQQMFLAVRDLLSQAAQKHPLILILEDLHWVDRPSLDLLLFLTSLVETVPLLFICISRPTDNHVVPQLERVGTMSLDAHFLHISLQPLSMHESNQLVAHLLTIADMPEPFLQLIPQRAEGNPFYLEEIIRALIDRNLIRRRGDRWEVTPGANISAFQVPRTLESLIMTRVDHLSESTRHVAQCASVIGRDFPVTLLARIAETNATRLENELQELIDHEVIAQASNADDRVARERYFSFRHILTQQTIYHSVLVRRREHLHHTIANAMEELYADRLDEQAERLAFHYGQALDAVKALPHVIRSAEHAAQRFANEQALAYFRTALDLAEKTQAPAEIRTKILIGLGDSQTHTGDFDGAETNLRAAWQLARSEAASPNQARRAADIARRLGRGYERRAKYDQAMYWLDSALREINRDVSSGHAVERVRIYLEIGWVHYRLNHLDEAEQWRMRALEIAEGLDYYAETGSAYNGLAALYNLRGDLERAVAYAERGLQLREMIGDLEGVSRSHSNLGGLLLNMGKWDSAYPHLKMSLELKQRIGDAKQLALAYYNLGLYHLYCGELKPARELFESAIAHAEKIRDPNAPCYSRNALAQVEMFEGNTQGAAELLRRVIEYARQGGAREALIEAQTVLAEIEVEQGNLDAARQNAAEALEASITSRMKQAEAQALRAMGALERVAQNFSTSEDYLQRSLALLLELQNPFEAARSEYELGLLYLEEGSATKAHPPLQHSLQVLEKLGAARYADRARSALFAAAPV